MCNVSRAPTNWLYDIVVAPIITNYYQTDHLFDINMHNQRTSQFSLFFTILCKCRSFILVIKSDKSCTNCITKKENVKKILRIYEYIIRYVTFLVVN